MIIDLITKDSENILLCALALNHACVLYIKTYMIKYIEVYLQPLVSWSFYKQQSSGR